MLHAAKKDEQTKGVHSRPIGVGKENVVVTKSRDTGSNSTMAHFSITWSNGKWLHDRHWPRLGFIYSIQLAEGSFGLQPGRNKTFTLPKFAVSFVLLYYVIRLPSHSSPSTPMKGRKAEHGMTYECFPHNTWSNRQSQLRLTRFDKIFCLPLSNTLFLALALLRWSFPRIPVRLRKYWWLKVSERRMALTQTPYLATV